MGVDDAGGGRDGEAAAAFGPMEAEVVGMQYRSGGGGVHPAIDLSMKGH